MPDGCAATNDSLRSTTATWPGITWLGSTGRVMKKISLTRTLSVILVYGPAYHPGARMVTIEGMGHDLPTAAWPQLLDEISEHAKAADRETVTAQ